jgi:ATP-binding cassette subfamily B protein
MMRQRAAASAGRIFEILDREPDVVDAPDARALARADGELEFDDVTFSYPDGTRALDRFGAHVLPGEAVALVGRTGCGKSTVARVLARNYDVEAGVVRIDGADVRDLTVPSLRAAVGIVLDEPFLFSATVRENIAYGRPDASLAEVVEAARAAEADGFIRRLSDGYDTRVGERGYTLSGGQRQRIAIARALLTDPRVLILDDATSAIDVQVEQRIHARLRERMRGRTTLILAHRLSTVSLADRVLLVEDGRVVARGTHAELLDTSEGYAELFGAPGEVAR